MAPIYRNQTKHGLAKMETKKIPETDRIDEILMMCPRNCPVYSQISNFSIALYALGYFDAPDLMAVDELDLTEAANVLRDDFTEIPGSNLPTDYCMGESQERYLLVIGDPEFPRHFAVAVDTRDKRPFFSKLRYTGSGYDSLEELMDEFEGEDNMDREDIHYFRKI